MPKRTHRPRSTQVLNPGPLSRGSALAAPRWGPTSAMPSTSRRPAEDDGELRLLCQQFPEEFRMQLQRDRAADQPATTPTRASAPGTSGVQTSATGPGAATKNPSQTKILGGLPQRAPGLEAPTAATPAADLYSDFLVAHRKAMGLEAMNKDLASYVAAPDAEFDTTMWPVWEAQCRRHRQLSTNMQNCVLALQQQLVGASPGPNAAALQKQHKEAQQKCAQANLLFKQMEALYQQGKKRVDEEAAMPPAPPCALPLPAPAPMAFPGLQDADAWPAPGSPAAGSKAAAGIRKAAQRAARAGGASLSPGLSGSDATTMPPAKAQATGEASTIVAAPVAPAVPLATFQLTVRTGTTPDKQPSCPADATHDQAKPSQHPATKGVARPLFSPEACMAPAALAPAEMQAAVDMTGASLPGATTAARPAAGGASTAAVPAAPRKAKLDVASTAPVSSVVGPAPCAVPPAAAKSAAKWETFQGSSAAQSPVKPAAAAKPGATAKGAARPAATPATDAQPAAAAAKPAVGRATAAQLTAAPKPAPTQATAAQPAASAKPAATLATAAQPAANDLPAPTPTVVSQPMPAAQPAVATKPAATPASAAQPTAAAKPAVIPEAAAQPAAAVTNPAATLASVAQSAAAAKPAAVSATAAQPAAAAKPAAVPATAAQPAAAAKPAAVSATAAQPAAAAKPAAVPASVPTAVVQPAQAGAPATMPVAVPQPATIACPASGITPPIQPLSAQQLPQSHPVDDSRDAPQPPAFTQDVIDKGNAYLKELQANHQAWVFLFRPIPNKAPPASVLLTAVDAVTQQPHYANVLTAIRYLELRKLGLGISDLGVEAYVRSLGVTDEYLFQDVPPGWRTKAWSVGSYMTTLLSKVVMADQAELLARLDTYIGSAEISSSQDTDLVPGCWCSAKAGHLVQQLLPQNKTKVLTWGLDTYGLDVVFAADRPSWMSMRGNKDASTRLFTWAKALGAKGEVLTAMLSAWLKQQSKVPASAAKIKTCMALVTSFVEDGSPTEMARQVLASVPELSVQWSGDTPPWVIDDSTRGSFLHLVLDRCHPDHCQGLVQVAVDRLIAEVYIPILGAEVTSDKTTQEQVDEQLSQYVNQEASNGRTPLSILLRRCQRARSPALAPHLPAVLRVLISSFADPLLVDKTSTTPIHDLISYVDKGTIDADTGAQALVPMTCRLKVDRLDDVVVKVDSGSCSTMNALSAVVHSTQASLLLEAILQSKPKVNPVKLLQLRASSGKGKGAGKQLYTPLSLALTAKPPKTIIAKSLLMQWRPEMLLAALDSRQPASHREAVKLFALKQTSILKPMAKMTAEELQPLIDMSLVEPNLLELLLKAAPQARFTSFDLISQEMPVVWLGDLISRGAHAKLGPGCKFTFLQGYLEQALDKHSFPKTRHQGTLPYDQLLPSGQRWSRLESSDLFHQRECQTFRLIKLLEATDQDGVGPLSRTHLKHCKVKVASMFGKGMGAGTSTTKLFKVLLESGCVDPNERDPTRCGMTLLHLAAADSASEAVVALCLAGADVMARIEPRVASVTADAAPSPQSTGAATLDTLHDNMSGFIPLHIAIKVFADTCALSGNPPDCTPQQAAQVLEYSSRTAARVQLRASGKGVMDGLLATRGPEQIRALSSSALTGPALHLYDSLCVGHQPSTETFNGLIGNQPLEAAAAALAPQLQGPSGPSHGVNAGPAQPLPAAAPQLTPEERLNQSIRETASGPGVMPMGEMATLWGKLSPRKQNQSLGVLIQVMSSDSSGLANSAPSDGGAVPSNDQAAGVDQQADALRQVLDTMLPAQDRGWTLTDDQVLDDENAVYSDDDVPDSVALLGQSPSQRPFNTAPRPPPSPARLSIGTGVRAEASSSAPAGVMRTTAARLLNFFLPDRDTCKKGEDTTQPADQSPRQRPQRSGGAAGPAETPGSSGARTAERTGSSGAKEAVAAGAPDKAAGCGVDPEAFLQDLIWMFTITKEARASWASLPHYAKDLVLKRLKEMGKGMWQRAGGVKRLSPGDDPQLRGLDLWRLKLTRGGRILFEVAVEYNEAHGCWSECIRLWCITLSHKKYEECITAVHDSYRRSQQVRDKRKLQAMLPGTPGGGAHGMPDAVRLPRAFQDVVGQGSAPPSPARGVGSPVARNSAGSRSPGAEGYYGRAVGPQREHLPAANYDPEQFTLLKMYNVDKVLLQTVFQGLTDAKVELPFKVSPSEWAIITHTPNPPCSQILLGRSGTGKTTCAIYRMWAKWLSGYAQWIPGQQTLAAAAAKDGVVAAGMDVDGAAAAAAGFAAQTIGGTAVFVTANATLKETVKRAFRKMQFAAMRPEEYRAMEAAGRVVYHSFRGVPAEAFPLFLTARQYLEMVDGTTRSPFFKRRVDGSIIKAQSPDQVDDDSADVVINLEFDQEQGDDYEGEDEDIMGNVEAAEGEEEEEDDQLVVDQGVRGEGAGHQHPAALAGLVSVSKEVTWLYFRNVMWTKITTSEQRGRLQPALVWAEICSYIKGSLEAIDQDDGHLDLDGYLSLGQKQAANFSSEMRRDDIWPIFKKYQRVKAQERRYDMMDFVAHVYSNLKREGYQGVPITALYRDEVQDFTQAELALDLRVVSDPNTLFYCGDTAQTIARGVGFRFADIKTLLHVEGERRKEQQLLKGVKPHQIVEVGKAEIVQLVTNYRTHQGILNTAAVVVDLIKMYYPHSIDNLEREKALFPGPDPILLAGTELADLTYLLCGGGADSRGRDSKVEFGANQVVLVRSMAACDELPDEIRHSNALIMTVPQAKGLEFDDVFLFNFFRDSVADAAEWRVINKFVEEFRAKGKDHRAARDNPDLVKRFEEHGAAAQAGQTSKKEEGYLRPVSFEPRQHVLLQEELKHLYTAITRAKSNVVFFDLDKEKRAPFYNLLRSFGMARVVNRSLLDDGADAKTFGLAHHAQSSESEWFKRATSLMEKGRPGLAEKAFRQANDHVRAEVALARQLRLEAAGADDQEQLSGHTPLTQDQKRLKLREVVFRLLLAVRKADQAPVRVSSREVQRWVRLAAQCLTELKQPAEAAQMHALVHNYKTAREVLVGLGDHKLMAKVCMRAHEFYTTKTDAAKAPLQVARSRLLMSGATLAQALQGPKQDAMARITLQAEQDEEEVASATRRAQVYLARGVHAHWLAGDREAAIKALTQHGITSDVLRVWPTVAQDLLNLPRTDQVPEPLLMAARCVHIRPDAPQRAASVQPSAATGNVGGAAAKSRAAQGDSGVASAAVAKSLDAAHRPTLSDEEEEEGEEEDWGPVGKGGMRGLGDGGGQQSGPNSQAAQSRRRQNRGGQGSGRGGRRGHGGRGSAEGHTGR